MKSISFLIASFACMQLGFAQSAAEFQSSAHSFTQQGDYINAILILNKATQMAPGNIEITKDLALNYYLNRDDNKALETIKPVLDRQDADDQCYQIAGNIYKQLSLPKDCEKLFRKGIKKFPESGAMFNELGELLWAQQDYTAIKQWEKGIEIDPNYSKNYYNACKFYYLTADNVWTILYGEIFINMEPLNASAAEIKDILSEGYKKLFVAMPKLNKDKNKFENAFVEMMSKQSNIASNGITAETITMIRTRFILDWSQDYATKFPYKLFELLDVRGDYAFVKFGKVPTPNIWLRVDQLEDFN